MSDQILRRYQESTIIYGLVLTIPILALAAIVLVQGWRSRRAEPAAAQVEERSEMADGPGIRRMIAFVALLAVCLLVLESVGYLLTFLGFLVASMLLLGIRSPILLASVSLGVTALVHFLFVGLLGMQFPVGILAL